MKHKIKHVKLKRGLGLFQATLYGIGVILGAGIYVLIGSAAGIAGNSLWISFIIAAVIASFTGLSYAELSSAYPRDAAEYVYTFKAFRKKSFSFVISWLMIITGIISVAAVSIGFAGYFSFIFGGPPMIIAIMLIVILSMLNYLGIKVSAEYNTLATLVEMSGLIIVAIIGFFFFNPSTDYFEMSFGWNGIITATALIFFAYLGFEEVANISEETKNARRNIPRALLISVLVSTALYILVSVSCVGVLGWENLATSKAPLADVAGKVMPNAGILMAFIALFATSNTVLAVLIVMSRMLYGVSRQHSLPGILSRLDPRRNTPYISVFLVGILSIISLAIGTIEIVAMLTNLGIFIIYLFINISLIKLRYSSSYKPGFRAPVNIGKMPVLAFLGSASSVVMLFYTVNRLISVNEGDALILMAFLIACGYAIFKIFNKS